MCDSVLSTFPALSYLIVTRAREVSITIFLFRDEKTEGQRVQLANCRTAKCGVGWGGVELGGVVWGGVGWGEVGWGRVGWGGCFT